MVIGALMVAILAFMLLLLQQQFNQADERRAVALVGAAPAGPSRSLGEELAARAGERPLDCKAKILSSFRGTLEVACRTGDSTAEPYRFAVDLVRKTVSPLDSRARGLIAPPDGGP